MTESHDLLSRKLEAAREGLGRFARRVESLPPAQQQLFDEMLAEHSAALEEMHAAGEAIQQQNEELLIARRQLEAERRRYRNLFELAPDERKCDERLLFERDRAQKYLDIARTILLVLDARGRVSLINRQGAEVLGRPEAEIVGQDWFETFLPEAARDEGRALFRRRIAAEELPDSVESEIVTRSGETRIVTWNHSVLRDADGTIIGVLSSGEDVTDRARAETGQRKAADLNQLLLDSLPHPAMLIRRDRVILAANDAARAMGAKVGGYCWLEFARGEHVSEEERQLARECGPEALRGVHCLFCRADLALNFLEPKRTEVAALGGLWDTFWIPINENLFLHYAIDITEERRRESEREAMLREIARHRDTLETVMENTQTHLAYVDCDFRFIMVNSTYAKGSGHTKEQLIGRNHFELFPDEENERIFRQVRDTGEPVRFEARPFTYADQPERGVTYWDWTLVPVKNEAGHVEGLVFSLLDVTERVRAGRERELLLEKFREAKNEAERRAEEQKAIFEGMTDAVIVYDAKGRGRHANPRAVLEMGFDPVGLSRREVIERIQLRSPDGKAVTLADSPIAGALRGKTVLCQQYLIRDRQGRDRMILLSSSPLLTAESEVEGAVAVWHDVTEREELVRRIDEQRKLLDSIVAHAPVGIVVADNQARILMTNPTADWLYHRAVPVGRAYETHAELKICRPDGTPCPPADLPLTRSALHGEVLTNVELGIVWPDEQWRDLLVSTAPLRDEEGRITGAVGLFQDITPLKKAESALRRIEWLLTRSIKRAPGENPLHRFPPPSYGNLVELNRTRTLLDAVGQEVLADIMADTLDLLDTAAAVCEKNGDYALALYSSNWCRTLDEASRQLCGECPNEEALRGGRWLCRQSCWGRASEQCIEAGAAIEADCLGGLRLYCVPVRARGEVIGTLSFAYGDPPRDPETLHDLSERYGVSLGQLMQMARGYESRPPFIIEVAKNRLLTSANLIGAIVEEKWAKAEVRQLNASLEQTVADLQQANRDLESFNYTVSHDLRGPLTVIDGFSDVLMQDHEPQLDEEGRRCLKVIRETSTRMGVLIDGLLAFSRIGRKPIQPTGVNMTELIEGVFEEVRLIHRGTPARLEVGPLPPALGDFLMLRQALTNLLDNAVKFSRTHEAPVVRVTAESNETETTYCVRDNGVGFDMKYGNKLFGVFQRLHRADEFEGTGLGLAIMQRVIQRHGGRVWAESQVGEGASFYFTLPCAESP
jgi:PAS domain S-box-containing protein